MNFRVCIFLFLFCFVSLVSCTNVKQYEGENPPIGVRDIDDIIESDTLVVTTLYNPISYFIYREVPMGYDYEFAEYLCQEIGVNLKLVVADDLEQMIKMVENGEADLVAFRVPHLQEYNSRIAYTEREFITEQVIVQCMSDTIAKSVLELDGKNVYVTKDERYLSRLRDLNNEIGGGININVANDSLQIEDLIVHVAQQKIESSVANSDLARLNKTYFGNLDYSLKISFPQKSAWVVSNKSPKLLTFVNEWTHNTKKKLYFTSLYNKYFNKSKYFISQEYESIDNKKRLSPFDDYFKKYAPEINWDWRLLAAVAYKESKFDPSIEAWTGAAGLMQLMPSTAHSLGLSKADVRDPEKNIKASVAYLKKLIRLFPGVEDKQEKKKFLLGSYNVGQGHIFDARALARKYNKNADLWQDVAEFLELKSDEKFYTDSVCKFGYCRGSEPVNYVNDIFAKYDQYKQWVTK